MNEFQIVGMVLIWLSGFIMGASFIAIIVFIGTRRRLTNDTN